MLSTCKCPSFCDSDINHSLRCYLSVEIRIFWIIRKTHPVRYRLLRSYFVQTQHWTFRDPFYEQKIRTFQHSGTPILSRISVHSYLILSELIYFIEISTTMHGLEIDKQVIRSDPEKLKVLFNEMIQMCLW